MRTYSPFRKQVETFLHNTGLVIASVFFALAFVNAIYSHFESKYQRILFSNSPFQFFQYDPFLGWIGRANSSGSFKSYDYDIDVRNNSLGMRYHEVPEKRGFRVAVLGDSFTWGWGTAEGKRFTDILEKETGIEMLNYGVPGYGPIQYFLELDRVLKSKPDLVLIIFCLGNDFDDNVVNYRYTYFKPYARMAKDTLEIKGIPVPNVREYGESTRPPLTRLALGRWLYVNYGELWGYTLPDDYKIRRLITGMRIFSNDKWTPIYSSPNSRQVEKEVRINEALFKAIQQTLKKQHIPMAVFAAKTNRDRLNDNSLLFLERTTERLGIDFITGTDNFGSENFHALDSHWNDQGNENVAKFLTPALLTYKKKNEETHKN